jgi:hypothetical protein
VAHDVQFERAPALAQIETVKKWGAAMTDYPTTCHNTSCPRHDASESGCIDSSRHYVGLCVGFDSGQTADVCEFCERENSDEIYIFFKGKASFVCSDCVEAMRDIIGMKRMGGDVSSMEVKP